MTAAVTHRHRSKSAPRGRSPNGKALQKAAKKQTRDGSASDPYITPPNRSTKRPGSSEPKVMNPRKISFGRNTVHPIEAENPSKELGITEAEEILKTLNKDLFQFVPHNLGLFLNPPLHNILLNPFERGPKEA